MSVLGEVWRTQSPLVWRGLGPLKVRLPYASGNRALLRGRRGRNPIWRPVERYWEVPTAWFTRLCRELMGQFGHVYVVQPHRKREVCAPACWNARGLECECSCMGDHHGEGQPGGRWYVVSESCAVRWREREWHWSLLRRALTRK